jgi:hypothetical protein
MKGLALAIATSLLTLVGIGAAHATVYDLSVDSCSSGCGKTDYGTITVTPSNGGDTLDVSIALAANVFFNQAGNGLDAIAFDLIGNPSVSFTGLPSTFSVLSPQSGGSHHEDGLGNFGYIIDWVGPPTNNGSLGVQSLDFQITGASPLTLGFNLKNGQEVFFSVDIASLLDNGSVATGVVGATTSAVPEPEAWALLILGIGGLGATLRMKRRTSGFALAA